MIVWIYQDFTNIWLDLQKGSSTHPLLPTLTICNFRLVKLLTWNLVSRKHQHNLMATYSTSGQIWYHTHHRCHTYPFTAAAYSAILHFGICHHTPYHHYGNEYKYCTRNHYEVDFLIRKIQWNEEMQITIPIY